MNGRGVMRVGYLLLLLASVVSTQAKVSKVFLLEDSPNMRWCSYLSEPMWMATVEEVGAMTVGTLLYSNGHLEEIDLTETDESGDWIVYDRYFIDENAHLVKLVRLLNVLPSDRSVSEVFAISKGHALKTNGVEKELSTGKRVASSQEAWLPEVPIETDLKGFPFSRLLELPDIRTSSKCCVKVYKGGS